MGLDLGWEGFKAAPLGRLFMCWDSGPAAAWTFDHVSRGGRGGGD